MLPVALIVAGVIGYVAYRTRPVPTPRRKWHRFSQPDAVPLDPLTCQQLQGIYIIEEGKSFFGENAVVKWSYTVEEKKTLYHLSFFCEKSGTYIIAEGKRQFNDILLCGHWRKAAANGTGIVQLQIKAAQGGRALLNAQPVADDVVIQGMFGDGDDAPTNRITLRYQQPLPNKPPFEIIAHRGGARNVDFLPVSENTLDMMKMAARLGATGVEIDVRMTRDNVPVIFHDSFLSIHTVQDKLYGGLVHNYTLQELKQITLRKGGQVPTLQETLHTVLYHTPLQTVWLDIKKECDFRIIRNLQREYTQKAAALGRELNIYIGIPDKAILKCFTELEDYKQLPSLTELGVETVFEINAQVWAPQYVNGFQREKVDKLHAAGRKAYVWSLDNRFLIDLFISEGGYDGVVTNTPSVVAHWYYTVEEEKLLTK